MSDVRDAIRQLDATIYIVHTSGDPLAGRVELVSTGTFRLLGYKAEEFSQDPGLWHRIMHPDDVPKVVQQTQEVFRFREPRTRTYRLRHAVSGEYRWIEDSTVPLSDEQGNLIGIAGVARDVSESRAAEQRLAYLSSIVKSSDDSIVSTDLDGVIVSWNRGAERMSGYTEKEALGKHLVLLFPQDRQNECGDNLRRIKNGEHPPRCESRRRRKDGSEFDVSVIVSPIEDRDGKLVGMSSISRDITERKRADAALQVARLAAEIGSRTKSEFLANMGHELRTPLNGVLGLTEVVLDSELTEEQRECLTLARDSARSLLTIVSDILDISKIQSGKYLLQPKEFCLRDLVETTMKEFETAARDKHLRLTWHIQPNLPPVLLGDSGCLHQILSNLIQNAIKFTETGEVEVSVANSLEDPVLLSFAVCDTGMGVPADQQRTVFDPFSQVDNSLRRKFGGTGLGLAICAQLTEIMGGRIWVESNGHTGSTFHFTVRIDPVHAATKKTPTEPEVPTPATERRRGTRRTTHDLARMRILRPFSPLPLEVEILDVSPTGLKIHASQSLDPGALVQIDSKDTVAIANVRYCIPAGNRFQVGLDIVLG